MNKDERKQIRSFQDEIATLIDRYLDEGMHPEFISEVLNDESGRALAQKRREYGSHQ